MNAESSRSHLIFAIVVNSKNKTTGQTTTGKLTFVDLAGSERSDKTGVKGKGAQEALQINKSLSALGLVIKALSEGQTHIPYRDHKLTLMLKDSLGGTAKTLMFVNCSPSIYNESESKSSLEFAERVKKVKNKASKNVDTKESKKFKAVIEVYGNTLDAMKDLIEMSLNTEGLREIEKKH